MVHVFSICTYSSIVGKLQNMKHVLVLKESIMSGLALRTGPVGLEYEAERVKARAARDPLAGCCNRVRTLAEC